MTTTTTPIATMFSLVIWLLLVSAIAIEDLVCMKNHTFMETSGDAVLSVFIDTDYGPECNISSPRSIQEVATALYVAQQLNRADYVPGVTLGLRIYDTCNDRIAVYKQALVSAVEMDCSAHYDLGLLVPARYGEVLEPLRALDLLPVNTYAPPNLTLPMLDVLVDFLAGRYSRVDMLLADSRPVLDAFLRKSREAGICVKSDKGGVTEAETQVDKSGNATTTTNAEQQQLVVVALGDYEDVTTWLEKGGFGDEDDDDDEEDDKKIWIVMTLDNSHVDDYVPEGSYLIKPEHFVVDLGPDGELDNGDSSSSDDDIPASTIVRSPHVLSVGKAILEIAKGLRELQQTSCPYSSSSGTSNEGGGGGTSCVLPRFEPELRKPMSNSEVYETLKVPAKSHSTRYVVSRKIDGSLSETTAYQIDSTSARYRVVAEKEQPRLARLCVRNYTRRCQQSCANFKLLELEADQHDQHEEDDEDNHHRVLKPQVWVPILLTISSCATFACCAILAFVVYRYFVEDILDGNPLLTCLLIGATLLMLQSALPFCLEDRAMGAEHLNSRKILVSGLGFGLAFSVMLTRALFLAFSSKGVFSTQHINGYLQCLMLLFMAGVELAIATMYFALSDADSARVARSPVYIALLGYDIFLLCSLFASCFFVSHVQRNYREGTCFFATGIGLLVCWAVWITCFLLMGQDKRDAIVCSGTVATACLIICGVLVPRTYFMCSHYVRDKSYVHAAAASAMAASRFAGPLPPDHLLMDDPRFVNAPLAARQGAYLDVGINGRQPFYEYVSATGSPSAQQQQALAAGSNYYYGGGNELVTRPTTSAAAAAALGAAVPSHLMTGTTTTTGAGPTSVTGKNRGGGGGMLSRLSFRRGRSPEPRRTPGYSNYGFRPEMRELDVATAANVAAQQPQPYVVPRLYVDEPDPYPARGAATATSRSSSRNSREYEERRAVFEGRLGAVGGSLRPSPLAAAEKSQQKFGGSGSRSGSPRPVVYDSTAADRARGVRQGASQYL
ncbi:uncharacterized protein LOC106648075 isoform X2 [Trichogramma pretiosum]|uniref:uncharacterized protein LOC106648075 isoform X2 n=1 Tax=Trichogramma pretiosum TaxID=7493 RepID=UPI0006C98E2D|nr:uncharacterized protein LOC106648075 isoform X2 [Trichogramma pretiosum]